MNYILLLGILLLLGLLSTRVVKKLKLPNVTGYLVIGLLTALICILIDKFANQSFTNELIKLNDVLSDVALGFIALSIGEEFKLSKIKEYGMKIISITIIQAMLAVILVDIGLVVICLLLGLTPAIAICLGAIAAATAPAATLMVIHQYKAKGPLVDILLPVVAFDDAIGLIVFAISVSIAKVISSGSPITFMSICLIPLLDIIGSILIGFLLGVLLHYVVKFFQSRNNHIINLITFTLLGVGICKAINNISIAGESLEFSNLLCCMMIGAVYINMAKNDEKEIVERDFGLIDRWTPALFMLFFVLSGTHLVTSANEILTNSDINFVYVFIIFLGYLILRSVGKILGAYIGCKITHRIPTITKHLGITLLPQAGVAIGMANQISNNAAFTASGIGNVIVTVVLCATLVYELVGPLLTKWSLEKAGEIPNELGVYPYEMQNNK